MTGPPPIPAPPAPGEKTLEFRPSFLGGLRGVWLFTWRAQMTWKRLPARLLLLLILPVLIFFSVKSHQEWKKRYFWIGVPPQQLGDLARRMERTELTLTPEQAEKLLQIYREEYARADAARDEKRSAAEQEEQRVAEAKGAHERLLERARAVLDERQFKVFKSWDGRRLVQETRPVAVAMWSRPEPFYRWLVDFYFFMIVPLVCVRGCGALIRDELQADTLSFLTTRPLTRAQLLVCKFLAEMTWLQLLLLGETLLLFVAGAGKEVPALGILLPLFLGTQLLAVLVWSALGILLGQVTQRYMAVALVYGLVVELGIGRIPTNLNTLSMMRHLKSLLGRNEALQAVYDWPTRGVPFSVVAVICAAVVFLGVAVGLFNYREYHHTTEMQK